MDALLSSARRAANKRYGYGRAEDLRGLFVIAMILLSSLLAAYEAIDRLLNPREVHHAEDYLFADVRRLPAVTVHVSPVGAHG